MVVHFVARLLACPETKLGTEVVDGKETKNLYTTWRGIAVKTAILYITVSTKDDVVQQERT